MLLQFTEMLQLYEEEKTVFLMHSSTVLGMHP